MRALNALAEIGPATATAAWVTFRYLRRSLYSLAGRNPLVRGIHAPTLAQEWTTVRSLLRAKASPSVLIREGRMDTYQTLLGEIAVPHGAKQWFLQYVLQEILTNIYALRLQDRVVVDCGANIGLFAKYALMTAAQRVVAF